MTRQPFNVVPSSHALPISQRSDSCWPGAVQIEFGGVQLTLLPQRAVWWPSEQALFIADLHIGKDATFRSAGIPLPNMLPHDLALLSHLIDAHQPRQLFVLGDLLHSRFGRTPSVIETVANWRATLPNVDILLVRGNHDHHAGDPPASWKITCLDAPATFQSLSLIHRPTFEEHVPTLAGHLHPKFHLRRGADSLRLPGFLHRRNTLVLPAFTHFADHDLIRTEPTDSNFIIADSEVIHL